MKCEVNKLKAIGSGHIQVARQANEKSILYNNLQLIFIGIFELYCRNHGIKIFFFANIELDD